jgi:glucokinase
MERRLIGVDIGGTHVRMGIITPEGKVLRKVEYLTDVSKGGLVLFENLILHLRDLIQKNINPPRTLMGIGIGVAGIIEIQRGIIHHSPNLPGLNGFKLRDFLRGEIFSPIVIENDANAFTLGEGWMGAARGSKNYCGITLGTGVGGGIVVEGNVLHGSEGMAGEVGHMVINPEGLLCNCGGKGCLEVYASGTGIKRMAMEALVKRRGKGVLKGRGRSPEKITSEKVFKAAQSGDLAAKEIFMRMGGYLGLGLVNLVHLFNPEKIVIGGKVSRAWDYFIGDTMKTFQEKAMKGPKERVEIVRALCDDEAGILGAAYSVLQGKFR